MSNTVDQRILEMRFDNKQFERNVSTTLSSLDKLKQSLNMTGATKGLENVGMAAKGINLSGLSGAVATVSTKFSALGVMGVTALANITNAAVNAGKRIISALTIDPIKTGFSEYETKINAIQTIMSNTASKGTTMADVTRVIGELNTYADKTIYNFAEMTRNIGTFTAAGVGLEDSAAAIQGIANLAASSGSTSQQASTAMYQLSQALAAGTVKLMDWNSVVNAGMGGEKFQEALKATAREHGIAVDSIIKEQGSFRESLSQGWISADILNETLRKFTVEGAKEYAESMKASGKYTEAQAAALIKEAQSMEDAATKVKTLTQLWDTLKESAQSGWSQTWELVIGNFEEAKELFTEVSDTIGGLINASSDARNKLLTGALTSGWDQLVATGIKDAAGFQDKVTEMSKSYGVDLKSMMKDGKTFQEALKEGLLDSDNLTKSVSEYAKKLNKMSDEELKAAGYTDSMVKELKTLTSSLKNGSINAKEFTSQLMTKSLNDYTKELSKMSDKELEAAGYTREMVTEMKTLLGQFKNGSLSMEEFVEKMTRPSGRELLVESLRNSFEAIMSIATPIKEAFRDIFPRTTAEQLYNIIEAIEEFTSKLKLGETASDNLKRTFKGVFAVADILKEAFIAVFDAIAPLVGGVSDLGGGFLSVTARIGDWLVSLRDSIKETNIFGEAAQKIAKVIETTITVVGKLVDGFKELYGSIKERFVLPGIEALHAFLERIHERMSRVGDTASGMKSIVVVAFEAIAGAIMNSDLLGAFRAIWDGIKSVGEAIFEAAGFLTEGLIEKIGNADFKGAFDILNSAIAGGIGIGIIDFIKSVTKTFKSFQDIVGSVVDVFDGVRGALQAYQTQLKAGTLIKIATAIGILAAAIVAVSLIDSEKLSASIGAITMLFADLMGAMAIFGKASGSIKGIKRTATAVATMTGIATSVLILAGALAIIGSLDFGEMMTGLVGVIGLTATMVGAVAALGKFGGNGIKGAMQMVIFAAAIKILAGVCEDLAALDWNQLAKGLTGVGVLLAEVAGFMVLAKYGKMSITSATGIVIIAAAIKVLASACADFGDMDWSQIGKGLTSIGILLAEVAAFTNLTGNAKHVVSTGVALIAIGAAMKIFASAVQDFSKMNWDKLGGGLAGMAGALVAVTVALKLMPKNMITMGVGLIAVSAALLIIADVLDKMGGMEWENIAKGLTALGGSLGILAVALIAMKNSLAGAAALVVATAALALLTPILITLGAMSWESIAKGLVAIGGALAIIGIAGAILSPIVPAILGLAGAFALVGVGVLAIGAGLMAAGAGLSAVAVGITALAGSLTAGVTAIVAGLTAIIMGIASLIPAIAVKLGEAIIALCGVIIDGAPAIGEAIKALVLTAVDVLVECIPAIVEGLMSMGVQLWAALVQYAPTIVDYIFDFVTLVLNTFAERIPDLIQSIANVFMGLFSGVVDALANIDVSVLVKGIAGIGIMAAVMAALSAVAALVPGAMLGVLGIGAVIAELALVLAAVGALAQIPGLDWLINEGGDLLQSIGTAIGKFVGGIVGGFMSGVSSQFPQIGSDLAAFMTNVQPFIDGAKSIDASILDGVKTLTSTIIMLTGAEILDGIASWFTGGSSLADFGAEIAAFGPHLKAFADSVAGINPVAVVAAAGAAKALAEMASIVPNEGGMVAWFTGENSLANFGTELVAFGASLKAYSIAVTGVDSTAVMNSATAAKALADMANTVPNEGGVLGWFAGENSLAKFGSQIVSFGTSLKLYSIAVAGLDVAAVTSSVTAAKSLADLANNIPNEGGVVAWFSGENSIAAFGDQIVEFGKDFATYSQHMAGVDASVITATSAAAKSIVELANNIPEDKLFKNETTLDEFGSQMAEFGGYFSSYYDSISTVDADKMSSVVTEVWRLLNLAENMSGVDFSGMTGFSSALTQLGNAGIEGFISAFSNAYPQVIQAANQMIVTFLSEVERLQPTVKDTFVMMVEAILTAIKNKYSKFEDVGEQLVIKVKGGMESKRHTVLTAVTNLMEGALALFDQYQGSFYESGCEAATGFAKGIEDNIGWIEDAAQRAAEAASAAANAALEINSPSKVFYRTGSGTVEGFVDAVHDGMSTVWNASSDMAYEAVDGFNYVVSKIGDLIENGIDAEPTIRPVLDLSNVESGARRLNAMLSTSQAMSISSSMNQSRSSVSHNQNGVATAGAVNNFAFTQNNYSPKALSKTDIYRQTKNQFSAMERMVRA